mmetsp:Transcript_50963/g.110758  ORF Transcript_50963/g.110758 Transcript_50963/m.110758 type:complete len:90 (+) Transcript_50963:63-332(+)
MRHHQAVGSVCLVVRFSARLSHLPHPTQTLLPKPLALREALDDALREGSTMAAMAATEELTAQLKEMHTRLPHGSLLRQLLSHRATEKE